MSLHQTHGAADGGLKPTSPAKTELISILFELMLSEAAAVTDKEMLDPLMSPQVIARALVRRFLVIHSRPPN